MADMLEKLPTRTVALGLAACLAGVALSRLTQPEDNPGPFADTMQLESCLDEPPDEFVPPPSGPSEVDVQVHNGVAEGDPLEPYNTTIQKTSSTVVAIGRTANPDSPDAPFELVGTGFIVGVPDGRKLVLTAAHAIGGATREQITVFTGDGLPLKATGGCIVYGEPGHPKELDPDQKSINAPIDVAVLSLPPDDPAIRAVQPLQLATEAPRAGEQVDFVTYQGNHTPDFGFPVPDTIPYPATYPGLVAPRCPSQKNSYCVIDGDDQGKDDSIEPGASGAPVLRGNGKVLGMVFGARLTEGLLGPTPEAYGMNYSSKVDPRVAYLVPAPVLAEIVAGAAKKLP